MSSILLFNIIFILTFNKQHKFICRLPKYLCSKCLWYICTNNYINTPNTQPSLPYWMAITLPIGHLFLLVSSHNKTMYSTLKFLTILLHLWQTCKVAKTSFFHLLQNSFAKCCTCLHPVSYNICLLSGTLLGVV